MTELKNDPRLTAYILNELSPEETKEIEMLLEKDKEAKAEVEDIKAAVNIVTSDLNEEKPIEFSSEELEKLEGLASQDRKPFSSLIQKFMYWGGPAIAVCLLVVINVNKNKNEMIPHPNDLLNESRRIQLEQQKTVGQKTPTSTKKNEGGPLGQTADDEEELNIADAIAPLVERKEMSRSKLKKDFGYAKAKKISMAKPSRGRRDYKGAGGIGGKVSSRDSGMVASESVVMPGTTGRIDPWLDRAAPAKEPVNNNEQYDAIKNAEYSFVKNKPLSTFSIDVDTASYSNMRRFLNNGNLPPKDSVRIEEFVNYFNYDYKHTGKHPVSIHMEQSFSPWNKKNRLVKVAMKAKTIAKGERPASNFVFLLDVSGSMGASNKLPLLKNAMKLLTRKLTEKDKLAIVVYAGASGVVLPSTNGLEKAKILQSLTRLNSGGGTNGGAGIKLAYKIAKDNFVKGGNNRIILATDGDFNVGTTNRNTLVDLVQEKAKNDIFLTVLGLGMGNYKDGILETLADKGNGNYAYLDTLNEAKKVLITDMDKTLHTVAKDVKIQVEFNPKLVSAYRLIGYENRKMAAKDFNNDKKDAGEVGAGHNVTAFYEIVPSGVSIEGGNIDHLKYQNTKEKKSQPEKFAGEFMNVKVRYKTPTGTKSTKFEKPLIAKDIAFKSTSEDFRFAASVASFGMVLRKDNKVGDMNIFNILQTARGAKGKDKHGYRQEFIENVELAKDIYKTQNK
jgi:Ca-activated chloride channel homolog